MGEPKSGKRGCLEKVGGVQGTLNPKIVLKGCEEFSFQVARSARIKVGE